jgi:hypothetical protein
VEVDPAKGILEVSASVSTVNDKPVVSLNVEVITSLENGEVVMSVYPNPADQEIRVIMRTGRTEPVSLSLTDLNGKILTAMVHPASTENEYVLPLGSLELSQGLYLLQVRQGGLIRTVKVMKR